MFNQRHYRTYTHIYSKNNAEFNPANDQNNYSFSAKLSQTISGSSFWNLNAGFRRDGFESYDPHFKDNLYLYGDSATFANTFGVTLTRDGQRIQKDANNVFLGLRKN